MVGEIGIPDSTIPLDLTLKESFITHCALDVLVRASAEHGAVTNVVLAPILCPSRDLHWSGVVVEAKGDGVLANEGTRKRRRRPKDNLFWAVLVNNQRRITRNYIPPITDENVKVLLGPT